MPVSVTDSVTAKKSMRAACLIRHQVSVYLLSRFDGWKGAISHDLGFKADQEILRTHGTGRNQYPHLGSRKNESAYKTLCTPLSLRGHRSLTLSPMEIEEETSTNFWTHSNAMIKPQKKSFFASKLIRRQ